MPVDSSDTPNCQPLGEPHCVQHADGVIEYFSRGSGPTVVLLGMIRPASDYNALVRGLNDAGFRTLAVHLPGIGRSERRLRSRPTLWDFADDLTRVLADARVPADERVHLVGMAIGNRLARAFATRHAARTASVTLLAAGGKHRGWPPLSIIGGYLLLMLPGLSLKVRRKILEGMFCARRNVLPDDFCGRPPLRATLQQSGAVIRTDSREWWAGGRSPMLVLQGQEDRAAPAAYAVDLQREFPDRVELHLIPEAGHALLFDQPEVVTEHVIRFLNSQRSSAGQPAMSACG
uniref:Alpha/beta hydrolase n=1 Tax=Schlesneria paludicola TaxID=360056 RepID=A0A7C2JZR7_9PLAN